MCYNKNVKTAVQLNIISGYREKDVFSISFSRKGTRTVLLAWNKHIRGKLNSKCQRCEFKNPCASSLHIPTPDCVLNVDEYHKCVLEVVFFGFVFFFN